MTVWQTVATGPGANNPNAGSGIILDAQAARPQGYGTAGSTAGPALVLQSETLGGSVSKVVMAIWGFEEQEHHVVFAGAADLHAGRERQPAGAVSSGVGVESDEWAAIIMSLTVFSFQFFRIHDGTDGTDEKKPLETVEDMEDGTHTGLKPRC